MALFDHLFAKLMAVKTVKANSKLTVQELRLGTNNSFSIVLKS